MKKAVILLFLVFILVPNVVYGQSFSLDTLRVYADIEPGKSVEKFITVTYTGGDDDEKQVNVEVKTADWTHNDITHKPDILPANTTENSCVPWINISPRSFVLNKENKTVKVMVNINVPMELEHPEYNAILFFSTTNKPSENSNKVGVAIETRLAVILKLTDRKQAKIAGEVNSFNVERNDEEDGYDLMLKVKNIGNVLLFIEGTFNVIDEEGNLYGRGNIGRVPVSPNVTSNILHTWYGELDPGEYDVVSTIEVGSKENIELLEKHITVE